jgi:dGTPase
MEAADDIAYCVSDLEDSIEKGLVNESLALAEIEARFLARGFSEADPTYLPIKQALSNLKTHKREDHKPFTYTDFRTSLNRTIVRYGADRYVEQHDSVLDGTLEVLLPGSAPAGAILDVLKSYCRQFVYGHESIQRTELAGYTAVRGLLDHFRPLLSISRERFLAALNSEARDPSGVPIVIESKLLSLFPERYVNVYRHQLEAMGSDDRSKFFEWNARAHLVVDFVSGMTDDFSMTTYRTLAGMRL